MAHSNGKITAPINIETDIYAVLGIGPTAQGYDIGYACSNAHKKINYWSRCKPIRWNSMDVNLTNSNWWKAQGSNCGFYIKSFSTYSDLSSIIDGKLNGWEYEAPTGGNIPFRALDFDGYYHNATPPLGDMTSPGIVSNMSGNSFVVTFITRPTGNDTELGISDFERIKDYHFGVYAKHRTSNQYRRAIGTSTIGTGGSVTISSAGMPIGDWDMYGFIAENPIGQDEPEKANNFYTLPILGKKTFSVVSSFIRITVIGKALGQGKTGWVEWTIDIKNNSSAIRLTNNYIWFRFPGKDFTDPMIMGEKREKLEDVDVPANSTITLSGETLLDSRMTFLECNLIASFQSGTYIAKGMVLSPMPNP